MTEVDYSDEVIIITYAIIKPVIPVDTGVVYYIIQMSDIFINDLVVYASTINSLLFIKKEMEEILSGFNHKMTWLYSDLHAKREISYI